MMARPLQNHIHLSRQMSRLFPLFAPEPEISHDSTLAAKGESIQHYKSMDDEGVLNALSIVYSHRQLVFNTEDQYAICNAQRLQNNRR